jgi:hypothetical protein
MCCCAFANAWRFMSAAAEFAKQQQQQQQRCCCVLWPHLASKQAMQCGITKVPIMLSTAELWDCEPAHSQQHGVVLSKCYVCSLCPCLTRFDQV